MKKRLFCLVLTLLMLVSMIPVSVFAAHDSTGKPLDLTGDVYLALYTGDGFPGEPGEYPVENYMNLDGSYAANGFTKFAESAEGFLEESILNDVVQGTSGVWGVFSTTGASRYLAVQADGNGLVNAAPDGSVLKPHNPVLEQYIIQQAINKGIFSLPSDKELSDYTIVWYVIKYQRSDSAWHIDGKIVEKAAFSVNYYGNGNTGGSAPTGASGLHEGDTHTVQANTGNLVKKVGRDTYLFQGWNTNADGTGTHYSAGDVITIKDSDVTLYAEWYLQNRYTVTVVTKLDDIERNVDEIHAHSQGVYVLLEGTDEYIPLEKSSAGTYSTEVTQNGTYTVYFLLEDGTYEAAHGHSVVIYNQNGRTDFLNYTVNYVLGENGAWAEGEDPGVQVYHANSQVIASENIPQRPGYTFLYWVDQNGNQVNPGHQVTDKILERTVLTAQWQKNINVTVNITVNHKKDDQINTAAGKEEVRFQLLQTVDNVNQPYGEKLNLTWENQEWLEENTDEVTTYSYTFPNLPQALYNATATKSHYKLQSITHTGSTDSDQTIDIVLQYEPGTFDLDFVVKVNMEDVQEQSLLPKAVNVKVLVWDAQANTWRLIDQHAGDAAPITVFIDKDGNGAGFVPVWQKLPDQDELAAYRVVVSSFVMPNGQVVRADGTDFVNFVSDPASSGLYSAVSTVEPPESGAIHDGLNGAIFNSATTNEQTGVPTVTVDIKPYTVTFVAKTEEVNGTVDGKGTLTLEHQYLHPNLRNYYAESEDPNYVFAGWVDKDGNPLPNNYGQLLTSDMTYYATYSPPMIVKGEIVVERTYTQNGQIVEIKENDLAKRVVVILQRVINNNLVNVASYVADITYGDSGADGTGNYIFENVPNDGAAYRINVLASNYHTTYDNESDADLEYSAEEYAVVLGDDNEAIINVHLDMQPDLYTQLMEVDASRIAEAFRPYGVLAEVLYRDLGDIHHYDVIAQHEIEPYGVQISLSTQGYGYGSFDLWRYHTDGSRYEYQMNVAKVYGEVDGVFTHDGVEYNSDTAPYTISYGPATHYSAVAGGQSGVLKATLVPKTYEIRFEMGLEKDETVSGMDQFLTDGMDNEDYYSYAHTWSRGDSFSAYPYRPGYVFLGWVSGNEEAVKVENGGDITVGAGLAEDVVLTAQWKKLEGTAYAVRHLEMYTDKPLAGATVVENITAGTVVTANNEKKTIEGYKYYGALVGETFYREAEAPSMTVTEDNTKNVLTLYYIPDGSDGYTEQVESNLKLDKTAALVDNGTYTINLETYTLDNPVTTQILNNTPLDVVLVIDQSGSIIQKGYLDELQAALDHFIATLAYHGRQNEVDHRIAIVGYAGDDDEPPTSTDTSQYPIAGGNTTNWVNTGVFDSNGDFHPYPTTGFHYTKFEGAPEKDGIYYTVSDGEYVLMTHHDAYYHLISEVDAKNAVASGETVYGYIFDDAGQGHFIELTRNTSGLWLYGDKQLYSEDDFFTFHKDVWTHRKGLEPRQIHAYGTGSAYTCTDGHGDLFTRTETTDANPELSVYHDALTPVSLEAGGAGGINYHLEDAAHRIGSNGGTFVQYGIEMGNKIFEANPLEANSDRVRVMIMFTDGMPGIGTFDETVANQAISEAYITKNTHDAHVYTLGLYSSQDVTDDQTLFMNAVSSNYPSALEMDDLRQKTKYEKLPAGTTLTTSGGPYYAKYNNNYYELSYSNSWWNGGWRFQSGWRSITVSSSANPVVNASGKIGNYEIYSHIMVTDVDQASDDYYATTDSADQVEAYFSKVLQDITTKIRREIILHSDTIMRDIMGQGLVLTPGTTVTAYKVKGAYENGELVWENTRELVASVEIPKDPTDIMVSEETTNISYKLKDGTEVVKENVPYISIYNLNAQNPTDPHAPDYHPHTVEITGYDFDQWYIKEDHPGYKMVVEITRVEARDNVQWGRSVTTNHEQSGLWLPADENGNRELLRVFDQPNTIFVERAYVLDYGKEFYLSGWYFDDDGEKNATPVHIDCNIEDGMNWFDPTAPNTSNSTNENNLYGNTKYGNVHIDGDRVHYLPTSMNWHGFDQFYVFGETWRKTVLAQDANKNGIPEDDGMAHLWNKVTVIPANNIYYEDSFITTEDSNINGIEGWTFTGEWGLLEEDGANGNEETPEHLESAPYGDVHGWTDSLRDDVHFTDNSVHIAGQNNSIGAKAEFTFTGTGVEVYTRTNAQSGMVVAVLKQHSSEEDENGNQVEKIETIKSVAIDNLAVSGDYYHIPTVSFDKLTYGTYTLEIIATVASEEATGQKRYEYYIDGVRIYNPLGQTTNYAPEIVKDAYGLETNAVFTEIRDILLDYKDFNTDMPDSTDSKAGAVFIDWIRPGQESGNDQAGTGVPTYEIGTFQDYGPKNEVYLSAGQAIVLKVDPRNTYYVGLKSLTGAAIAANVSGIDQADPTVIQIDHTTDLYYRVTPVDGYIVIQNGSVAGQNEIGPILSVTNLRTTNLEDPAPNGGVLPVAQEESVSVMRRFALRMAETEKPSDPTEEEILSPTQQRAEAIRLIAQALFTSVRNWLGGTV